MAEIVIGLGGNIGRVVDNLRAAVEELREVVDVDAVSSLYRTEPVGHLDQPFFLNAVLRGRTALEPQQFIALFGGMEQATGRRREIPMGPRALDLDLLLYDDRVIDEPGLSVPHPRMTERRFVLVPLVEIAPDLLHPVLTRSMAELLEGLPHGASVERVDVSDWPPRPDR